VLLAAQRNDLTKIAALGQQVGGQVVELGNLPAGGLGDPPPRPRQRVGRSAELDHRFRDASELVRRGQVAAEQLDEPAGVPVDDREPFGRVPRREARELAVDVAQHRRSRGRCAGRVRSLGDVLSVDGETDVAEGVHIRNRVDGEEVLILEREPHHPLRQPTRLGHPRSAGQPMLLQDITGERPDRPVRVVGMQDHLDQVLRRALQQHDQLARRPRRDLAGERVDHRRGIRRPRRRRPVVEMASRPQPVIDRGAQYDQPVIVGCCREADGLRHGLVLLGCSHQQPPRHVVVEPIHRRRDRTIVAGGLAGHHDDRSGDDHAVDEPRCRSGGVPTSAPPGPDGRADTRRNTRTERRSTPWLVRRGHPPGQVPIAPAAQVNIPVRAGGTSA
jgi:hypothetical protein